MGDKELHPIRVLVAALDDELPGMLCSCIRRDTSMSLCAWCGNADDAVKLAGRYAPDAIALDLRMAGDGYEGVITHLKRTCRAEIVAMGPVTGYALRAMNAGAGDFIHLPVGGSESDCSMFAMDGAERLKVAALGRDAPVQDVDHRPKPVRLIAVKAAQGGPVQLACLLAGLPADCPPVLVTQRNPEQYGQDYASLLAGMTGRHVCAGMDGILLEPGNIVVVDAAKRVRIESAGGRIVLRLDTPSGTGDDMACALFRSAALALGGACAGVSLCGEGIDGLSELSKAGGIALLHNKHALLREYDYAPPFGLKELSVEDMAGEILRSSHS